jgi:hypothetical protein
MISAAKTLAWLSLIACLAIPYLFFRGWLEMPVYRTWLALASLAWFVFATYGLAKRT